MRSLQGFLYVGDLLVNDTGREYVQYGHRPREEAPILVRKTTLRSSISR